MKHTDMKTLYAETKEHVGKEVTVCGGVRTSRDSKAIAFIDINDGTAFKNMQLIADKDKISEELLKKAMPVGTAVKATGKFVESDKNGCEVQLKGIENFGECPADYP